MPHLSRTLILCLFLLAYSGQSFPTPPESGSPKANNGGTFQSPPVYGGIKGGAAEAGALTRPQSDFPPANSVGGRGGEFFVANQGQWDEPTLFRLSAGGTTWFVTTGGLTIDMKESDFPPTSTGGDFRSPPVHGGIKGGEIRGHVLRLTFINANPTPHYVGQDKLTSYSNYFIGRDKCRWKSFVGQYQRITATDVWPGIDVEYTASFPPANSGGAFRSPPVHGGTKGGSAEASALTRPESWDLRRAGSPTPPESFGVETIYHIHPNADPNQIILEYEGQDAPLRIDGEGNLILQTSLGEVKEQAPFAYQIEGNRRVQIPVRFKLLGDNRYGLQCEGYDHDNELVIDPLLYSTYFGGGDGVIDMGKDLQGNMLITGGTDDQSFPVTPGVYQTLPQGSSECYVSKITPDGLQPIFSTFLGGNGLDAAYCCIVDDQGAAYIGGTTYSTNWPLTIDAFDTVFDGNSEGFFSKLSLDGSTLEYSSYIGGGGLDYVYDLAQDTLSGEVYICGKARFVNTGFPVTEDALFPTSPGTSGFISIFDPADRGLAYSTFFPTSSNAGGTETDRVVPMGNRLVWIAGLTWGGCLITTENAIQDTFAGGDADAYYALLDLHNNQLDYSSYLGGTSAEEGCSILPITRDRIILTGTTRSANFPVTANALDTSFNQGFRDGYISVLQIPDSLVYSTYLGGSVQDGIDGVFSNSDGTIIVCGFTSSSDFPVTVDGYDTTCNQQDGFVCRLSADLSEMEYGTFIGGSDTDGLWCSLLDGQDSIWVAGETMSPDFPVTSDAYQSHLPSWNSNYFSHLYIGHTSNVSPPQKPIPTDFSLSVYPNPFNPTTTISYFLPKAGEVKIGVYDVLGRMTGTAGCAPTGIQSTGEHHITFDGSGLASGVYFLRVESGGHVVTRKMLLLK